MSRERGTSSTNQPDTVLDALQILSLILKKALLCTTIFMP